MKNIIENMGPAYFLASYKRAAFQKDNKIYSVLGLYFLVDGVKTLVDSDYQYGELLGTAPRRESDAYYHLDCGSDVPYLATEEARVERLNIVTRLYNEHLQNEPDCDDEDDEDYDQNAWDEFSSNSEYFDYYLDFLNTPDVCIQPDIATRPPSLPVVVELQSVACMDLESRTSTEIELDFFDSLRILGNNKERIVNVNETGRTVDTYQVVSVKQDTRCLRESSYTVATIIEYFRGANYKSFQEGIEYLRGLDATSRFNEIALNSNYVLKLKNNNIAILVQRPQLKTIAKFDIYSMRTSTYIPNLKELLKLEGIL